MALAVPLALDSTSARAEIGQFVEPVEVPKLLCDASCLEALSTVERVKLPSGLEFQDIKVGTGPAAPVGYQVVLHYILMTADGRVISNSLENGTPYDIRVGTGQVVAGLDEGLKTMRVGGIRRVYVPEGELSFPKGLPSAPGRPRVAPGAPVIFDVQLLYVPGLDDEE
ncbi:MAG: FKBP-type peptidyl-prolyl cis-trans isomerase, partial [bacterium]|jgi:peptidylprolyl isomerase